MSRTNAELDAIAAAREARLRETRMDRINRFLDPIFDRLARLLKWVVIG